MRSVASLQRFSLPVTDKDMSEYKKTGPSEAEKEGLRWALGNITASGVRIDGLLLEQHSQVLWAAARGSCRKEVAHAELSIEVLAKEWLPSLAGLPKCCAVSQGEV